MKKFIKENWFKVILVLLILAIILIYLFVIKPSQDKKELVQNNIKCQQEGYKMYEKEKEEFYTEHQFPYCKTFSDFNCISAINFYEPEFLFNKDLNTCLYKQKTFLITVDKSSSFSFESYKIKDVYSNKIFKKQNITENLKSHEEDIIGDKDYKYYEEK